MDQQLLRILVLNTLLHELGVPVPLAPTVMVAGASGTAPLALIAAIIIATVIGNSVWFVAGRRYGFRTLKFLCRATLSPDSYITRAEQSFARWSSSSIVVGRFIPGMSLLTPALAGALGMSWNRFILLSATGAGLWGLVFVGTGILLHDQLDAALRVLCALGGKALAVIIVLVAVYIAWRRFRRTVPQLSVQRTQIGELTALMDHGQTSLPIPVLTTNERVRC